MKHRNTPRVTATEQIDYLNSLPVAEVAAATGHHVDRHGIRPCIACGSDRRSSSDRRPPINVTDCRWHCHACGANGRGFDWVSYHATGDAYRPSDHDQLQDVLAAAEGLGLRAPNSTSSQPSVAARTKHADATPRYPPREELAALLAACVLPDQDPDVSLAMRDRGLDPVAVARECGDLALPGAATCPDWARYRGEPWSRSGHRWLSALRDSSGEIVSVQARAVAKGIRKTTNPTGYQVTGTMMLDRVALALVNGKTTGCDGRAVVVEGSPDVTTWATSFESGPRPAIIGTGAGMRPDCAPWLDALDTLILRTDHDPDQAGDRYAGQWAELARSAKPDIRILRSRDPGDGRDDNALLLAGELPPDPAEHCTQLEPSAQVSPLPTARRVEQPLGGRAESDRRFVEASIDWTELRCADLREPIFYVGEGLVVAGGVTLFSGVPFSGKTFAGLQMLAAIATGAPWLGFKTTQAPVGMLSLELPPYYLRKRLQAVLGEQEPQERISLIGRGEGGLSGRVDIERDMGGIKRWIRETGQRVTLIDALSRVHQGVENSATDMGHVMDCLSGLCDEGGSLVLIHHLAKTRSHGDGADLADFLSAIRGSGRLASDPLAVMGLFQSKGRTVLRAQANLGPEPTAVWLTQTDSGPFEVVTEPSAQRTTKQDRIRRLSEALRNSPGGLTMDQMREVCAPDKTCTRASQAGVEDQSDDRSHRASDKCVRRYLTVIAKSAGLVSAKPQQLKRSDRYYHPSALAEIDARDSAVEVKP